jgi:hypothetical protein
MRRVGEAGAYVPMAGAKRVQGLREVVEKAGEERA